MRSKDHPESMSLSEWDMPAHSGSRLSAKLGGGGDVARPPGLRSRPDRPLRAICQLLASSKARALARSAVGLSAQPPPCAT